MCIRILTMFESMAITNVCIKLQKKEIERTHVNEVQSSEYDCNYILEYYRCNI